MQVGRCLSPCVVGLSLTLMACGKGTADGAVEAAAATPAQQLLDQAIEAKGGLNRLQAADAWRGKLVTMFPSGARETGRLAYKGGRGRIDVKTATETTRSFITGQDRCVWKSGRVAVKCAAERAEQNKRHNVLLRASQLWPLKEPGWELTLGKKSIQGRELDSLEVKNDRGVGGVLMFDPESHLLVRFSSTSTIGGKVREWVSILSDHKEACGIKLAMKEEVMLDGGLQHTKALSDVKCGGIRDDHFDAPKQVTDGAVVERDALTRNAACYPKKGKYSEVPEMREALFGFVEESGLRPCRNEFIVEFKPKKKDDDDPEPQVTNVCVEIMEDAPAKPEKHGNFVLKRLEQTAVIAGYAVGAKPEQSWELAGRVRAEAKKRQLRLSGLIREIVHRDRLVAEGAADVREVQLRVKGRR